MPGRLPRSSDFPPSFELDIVPPPPSAPRHTNVLILLHGLGDTLQPFSQLGKQLKLPETTCISVQGFMPMPFNIGGFHWGDDFTFSQSSHDVNLDLDPGFARSIAMIKDKIILEGLVKQCGYVPREILLLGIGQGGIVALGAIASIADELAGVVTIGGPFPLSAKPTDPLTPTPVLLLGGSSDTAVTRQRIDETKASVKTLEYHQFKRPGDGMPTTREEMMPIMQFFARHLKSRSGVLKGSYEVN